MSGFPSLLETALCVGGLMFLLTPEVSRGAPLLINAQQNNVRNSPAYIRDHFAHIESLPFDGMAINTATTRLLMTNTARSYQAISNDFAPLNGLTFTRMTHNFAAINADRPADFFDEWSVVIGNFRTLAKVLKERGIEGIFFDNEEYQGHLFNYPDDCSYPAKPLAEYQAQARLRGKQIMQAMAEEYPGITVMAFHGPYSSFAGTPDQVRGGQTSWQAEDLRGPFSAGLIEGLDSRGKFVDGGEVYAYRTVNDFQVSYDFRKTGIASDEEVCPFIPDYLRAVWPQKVRVSFGLYNYGFAGQPMNPAIMRTTLERALRRCDDFVWLHFEDANWNAPGEISQAWLDAVVGARAAVGSPAVNAPPSVSITSPTAGVTYGKPVTIAISAAASDADGGSVSKVEFFSGSTKMGEDASAPYSFAWSDPPAGTYTLTARATDNSGAMTISTPLTVTVVAGFSANINFQPPGVTPPVGYLADTGEVYGSRGDGFAYGWNVSHAENTRDRLDNLDRRKATLCGFRSGGVWEIAVPNGSYEVTVGIGDGTYSSTYTINVEDVNYWSAQSLAAGAYATMTKTIAVSDGKLTIDQGNAGWEDTRIAYVLIAPPSASPAAPSGLVAMATSADGSSINLVWADNSSTETAFEVQRSTNPNFVPATLFTTLAADTVSLPQFGLVAGTTYYYRVRAIGDGVASVYSNVTTATPSVADIDGDGIPDLQEVAPLVVGVDDRHADSDHDGVSNAAEYFAGTDPLDSRSRPQITQTTVTREVGSTVTMTLHFPTVAGRHYFAEYTDFLGGGVWTFVPASDRIGNGEEQLISDMTNSTARFYRLRLSP